MLKYYEEHSEFDRFTSFDTAVGRLVTIDKEAWRRVLPPGFRHDGRYINRIETEHGVLFTGARPETHVRFPRRIYFQITRNCNLDCGYCFIKAGRQQPHVPQDAALQIADFMSAYGLMEVRLTGGEPTTHPDFLEIMHRFKERGVYVSVATNGIWSSRILDAFCNEPHLWIICSVDGGRDLHNRYRPGTFGTIIANLREMKRRNPTARIRLTTVLTRENRGQMMKLGEICAMVGAESITVIPLRPQVRDPEMKNLMVDGSEFRYVIEDLIRAQEHFGIPFTTTMETVYKEKIYCDPIVRKRSSCAAGREATNLDYDAASEEFLVYACSYSPACDLEAPVSLREPFLAGTFHRSNVSRFLDIWRGSSAWTVYRDLTVRSRACTGCEYLRNHQCTGSCPIQNIDYSRIDLEEEVMQQLVEQIRRTGEWYCYQNIEEQ